MSKRQKTEMPKRDELQPLERAVSDTLDEYLGRLHGIMACSWVFPDEFIEFLGDRGFCITEKTHIQELKEEVENLEILHTHACDRIDRDKKRIDRLKQQGGE